MMGWKTFIHKTEKEKREKANEAKNKKAGIKPALKNKNNLFFYLSGPFSVFSTS